jgi:hypothetical protein
MSRQLWSGEDDQDLVNYVERASIQPLERTLGYGFNCAMKSSQVPERESESDCLSHCLTVLYRRIDCPITFPLFFLLSFSMMHSV